MRVLRTLLLVIGVLSLGSSSYATFYNNEKGSPLLGLINGAQSTLDVEIYTMKDQAIVQAFEVALHRGVKIRIIQEPTPYMDTSCMIFEALDRKNDTPDCVNQKKLVADVKAAGGTYVPYNKILCGGNGLSGSCFEHGKMAIFDQTTVLLSTGNFDATSLCDMAEHPDVCNRDYSDVENAPSIIRSFETIFNNDLLAQPYDVMAILTKNGTQNKLTVSPDSMAPLVAFIRSAKKSLEIENQYVTDATLVNELVAAAKRGVKVTLMVSSLCRGADPTTSDVNAVAPIFKSFDSAGIKSLFFTDKITVGGNAGYLHAKTIIVDKKIAWLGSVNGSTTAITENREFGIFFNSVADVNALMGVMEADFSSPDAETFAQTQTCAKD